MKTRKFLFIFSIVVIILSLSGQPVVAQDETATALGTGFTYQGQLKDSGGNPITATCAIKFTLWDALSGSSQVGLASTVTGVSVVSGYFTASVNAGGEFGANAFTGLARWLEVGVKCGSESSFTTLAPRQALTAAPYAAFAINSGTLNGQLGTYYRNASNINAGTLGTGYYSAHSDLAAEGYLGNATNDLAVNNATLQSSLNADLLDGHHSNDFQARVTGTCAVGSVIRAINLDGSVVCQNDAPLNRVGGPKANKYATIDSISSGDTGKYTSITIGADGLPIISYYEVTGHDLQVAHCEQADCSGAVTLSTVDSAGDVGMYNSIAIGIDGLAIISYYDASNGDLKAAHCESVDCSAGATITTLDNTAGVLVGQYSSIAVASDSMPIISYYLSSAVAPHLRVAHCTDAACSAAPVISDADSSAGVGQYTSIAIGPFGLAAISYYDASNHDLKLARCSNFNCSSPSKTIIDSTDDVGQYSSLAFGNDGLAVMSYYDATAQDLKLAHCNDPACTAPSIISVLNTNNAGLYTSITIGSDGLPVVSLYKSAGGPGLRVAHCRDIACSDADTTAPITGALLGQYTAITLGADGLPIISLYDGTSLSLRTLHCSSNLCLPYVWRR